MFICETICICSWIVTWKTYLPKFCEILKKTKQPKIPYSKWETYLDEDSSFEKYNGANIYIKSVKQITALDSFNFYT